MSSAAEGACRDASDSSETQKWCDPLVSGSEQSWARGGSTGPGGTESERRFILIFVDNMIK